MLSARILLPALLLACAMTSCTVVPEAQRDCAFERDLALAAPVAAFVVAEATRTALRFADPLPYHGGAPATEIDRERYLVRYEQRGNSWLPAAEHRLLLAHPRARVEARPTSELPGYGFGADRALQFEIRAETAAVGGGARIHGTLPRDLLTSFEAALDRGLARHATQPTAMVELERARELSSAGEVDHARFHRDHAVLAANDPTLRAMVLRQVPAPDSAASARRHARERLAVDDLRTARMLLHTARRRDRDPGVDYELLWQLHRQRDEDAGALASALLAREFDDYAETIAILELQNSGLQALVERVTSMSPEHQALLDIAALPAATALK